MSIGLSPTSRQSRPPWSLERLVRERAIDVSFAKDRSTNASYSSACQSYIYFCHIHSFPIDPSADTLSLYVAWLCTYIKPKSVDTYLSAICSELEDLYPDVRKNRKSPLVKNTLAGAKKRFGTDTQRKDPLAVEDIIRVAQSFPTPSHDDLLFLALLLCAFYGVHRLGELVDHDRPDLRDSNKTIKRTSVKFYDNDECVSYWLPKHKADALFAGSEVVIRKFHEDFDPVPLIIRYISSRDARFPLHLQLFLTSAGRSPTRSWFMRRFRRLFSGNVSGHSPRSGAATFLAMLGWAREIIQRMGRWKSDAFEMYVRKNPSLLQAFLSGGRVPRTRSTMTAPS